MRFPVENTRRFNSGELGGGVTYQPPWTSKAELRKRHLKSLITTRSVSGTRYFNSTPVIASGRSWPAAARACITSNHRP